MLDLVKPADLLAQRWLGDEKPLRRAAKMKLLGDCQEVALVAEVDVHNHRL